MQFNKPKITVSCGIAQVGLPAGSGPGPPVAAHRSEPGHVKRLSFGFLKGRASWGSFSSVAVHAMGLPRKAKKKGPRDPREESPEEAIFGYFKGFWPC